MANNTTPDDSEPIAKKPAIVIAWDPELISPKEYAELIDIIADLSRLRGAAGIVRLRNPGFDVPITSGVCA